MYRKKILISLIIFIIILSFISLIPLDSIKSQIEKQSVKGNYQFGENVLQEIQLRVPLIMDIFLFLLLFVLLFPKSKFHWIHLGKMRLDFTFWMIFLIGVCARIIYLNEPMRTDESLTFVSFISKSFIVAISKFNSANNHIFATFLSNISCFVFGNHEWAIRLPVFLFGIGVIPLTYVLTKKLGYKSYIPTVLVATSSLMIHYSVSIRGYSIIAALFLMMMILKIYLVEKNNMFGWLIFSLLGALSIYTNATGLFGVIFVSLLLFIDLRGKAIKNFLLSQIGIILLTLVFYSPAILVSGTLFPNVPTDFGNVHTLTHLLFKEWLIDIPMILIIPILLGFLYNFKIAIKYILIFVISTFPLLIFGAIPPERAWVYMLPLFFIVATGRWKI